MLHKLGKAKNGGQGPNPRTLQVLMGSPPCTPSGKLQNNSGEVPEAGCGTGYWYWSDCQSEFDSQKQHLP